MPACSDSSTTYGPRERIAQLGESRLSDAECLALILRTGSAGVSAEQTAQALLRSFGGLAGLARASLREITGVTGIGPVRAAALVAAFGLARRWTELRFRPGRALRHAGDVARLVCEATRGATRESFFALLLDSRHCLLGMRTVSTGGLASAPVHPREVFAPAIRESAAALIVAHNHPSGDPTPSAQDRAVTERLRSVGALVGIEMLDHVVVGQDRYFSFADGAQAAIP